MNWCISQATLLTTPFAEDVNACADAGWKGVEIWLTKLEKHLETADIGSVQKLFADRGVTPVAAAYQGGLLVSQGEQRKAHFEHFRKRLELCESLGIPTLLIAADHAAKPDSTAFERAVVSLKQAAQWAAGFGVALALEFRGGDAVCTCLDTAIYFTEAAAEPNLGVCLDLFHYMKGPSKPEDLQRLTTANLAHVQLCDVAGVPREWMGDSDRILPGEGDFPVETILRRLTEISYARAVSLELMNPVLWKLKPSQVSEIALAAMAALEDSMKTRPA